MSTTTLPTISFLGDSITENDTSGVLAHEHWPAWVENLLALLGYDVPCRNFGASGNTSLQMLNRVHTLFAIRTGGTDAHPEFETPLVVPIMIGVNDPGNGISQAQTQANIEAAVRAIRNKVDGVAATVAAMPNKGLDDELVPIGARFWVVTDGSTTGGLATAAAPSFLNQPATVTGSASTGNVWIKRQHKTGENGWSRIADDLTRGPYPIVMSTHWDNSSTGDTVATPLAANVNVRAAQAAAATAQGVSYCNLYDRLKARIVAGYTVDGAGEWNCKSDNQHPNAEGGRVFAMEFLAWANETTCPHVTGKTWMEVFQN